MKRGRSDEVVTTEYCFSAPIPSPLKMAAVSDLHHCENEPVLDIIRHSGVDAVLVCGDFVHSYQYYERGIAFLGAAAAMCPTFCSVGNHELKCGRPIPRLVEECGAILLDNRAALFGGVWIGGLTSGCEQKQSKLKKTPPPDIAWLRQFSEQPGYKILLCHHPEYYPAYIRPLAVDITLSGHAHGGQWRVFGQGLFAPGQGFFPKYTSGLYEGRLIVSRGLGNMIRFPRIDNRPEVIVLTLNPTKA